MVALATKNGVVAVVPRQPERQRPENVRAVRLDPRCDDPSVPTEQLEENSNSIASDVDGAIYVVTNRAQYRVDWDGKRLRTRWATEYKRGRTGRRLHVVEPHRRLRPVARRRLRRARAARSSS